MIRTRGGRGFAVTLATLVGALVALPSVSFAQTASSPVYAAPRPMHGQKAVYEALQAANLSPDQMSHIQQLIATERSQAKATTDKSERKALKRQLKHDMFATMNPTQQAAFETRLREIKAERKAAKAGVAPPPVQP